jgi:hypothetical protein
MAWESVYNGSANSFDWAHNIALDDARRLLAVGKSSETGKNQVLWLMAYGAASGAPLWSAIQEDLTDASAPAAFQDEMGTGIAAAFNNGELASGRYAARVGAKRAWSARHLYASGSGRVLLSQLSTGSAGAFSPPARGLGALARPRTKTAVAMDLLPAGGGLQYSFRVYTSTGGLADGYSFVFSSTVPGWGLSDWSDCCYDPPARLSQDGAGNVYSLLGSRYDEDKGFGFLFGKLDTNAPGGHLDVWSYFPSAPGRALADGLVAGASGGIFILAKSHESDGRFLTRLFRFDDNVLTWRRDLFWEGKPVRDAALAMDPSGRVWVVESRTGRTLVFDQEGNLSESWGLLSDKESGRYIGSALADSKNHVFLAGSKGEDAWVASFVPEAALVVKNPCEIFNYPNPFDSRRSQTTIRYELPFDAETELAIYDQAGERLRAWKFPSAAPGGRMGVNEVPWDGTNELGRKAVQGMYLGRLDSAGASCHATIRIGVWH